MKRFGILLLVGALAPWVAAQDVRKPMGAWFDGYEILTFEAELAWALDLNADAHYAGPVYWQPDQNLFQRYSVIMLGRGGSRALTSEQVAGLGAWVADGGVLVLAAAEGPRLFGKEIPPWFGAKAWWGGDIKAGSAGIQQPAHPLAAGLDAENVAGLIGPGGVAELTTGVSVIGREGISFLMVNAHGRGHVVCLGGKLFPERPVGADEQIVTSMSPLAMRVWRNAANHFRLPRRSDAIERWGASKDGGHPGWWHWRSAGRDGGLAVWWRYEKEKPLGAASFYAPFPAEGETLASLDFNVGMAERCWKTFFLTHTVSLTNLTVTPTDLTLCGKGGKAIPATAMTVYVQEKPRPDFPRASYWLVEPKYVAPVGSPAVALGKNHTSTWWVKLKCVDIAPGEYAGALEFREGKKLLRRLPIKVVVWPLHQPGPEVLHYELEHDWFSMPGGYYIRPKDPARYNPDLLAVYMAHLAEMGVDFGQNSGSDVSKGYCNSFLRLKEDGRSWGEAIAKDPQLTRRDALPHLDFSGFDGMYFDNAIRAGLTSFSINFLNLNKMTPDEARWQAWYWREYATYLKERGYPRVYAKIMDEFGPDGVDEFIRQAKLIRPAGFRVYTTSPSFQYDPASVAKIDPYLDMWQWWGLSEPWPEIARRRGIAWDPDNELWSYTASSFWGSYSDYARGAGWSVAWRRHAGLHTHGYMRWHWNDHEGCLPGPDGPFDTVTVINNGQSVYQARYLAGLYGMIEKARQLPGARDAAAQVEQEIEKVIGWNRDALVPILAQDIGGPQVARLYGEGVREAFPQICLPPERYEAAKVRLFQLILRLKAAMGDVLPTVRYGDTALVASGRPACRLVCDENPSAAQTLQRHVRELAGADLPLLNAASAGKGAGARVVLGTWNGSPLIRESVAAHAPGEITAFYPGPGAYAVKPLPDIEGGALILIIGGDMDGLAKGAEFFGRFLVAEDRW